MFDFIWDIFYNISSLLCEIMQYIYETFELFAGTRSVQYQEEETFLINIFFNNPAISRLYWGMATIGIVFCFGFGIFNSSIIGLFTRIGFSSTLTSSVS